MADQFAKWRPAVGPTTPTPPAPGTPGATGVTVLPAEAGAPRTGQQVSGQIGAEVLPQLLATLATLPLGGEGGLAASLGAPWLTRMAVAGGAGFLGGLGGQALQGQPLNAGQAAQTGFGTMIGQGAGEGLSALGSGAAEGIYRNAFRPGKVAAAQARQTASRIAGAPVQAEDAALGRQALQNRVPLGPGLGGSGMDRIATIRAPLNAALDNANAEALQTGNAATIDELLGPVQSLRADLAKETNGVKKVAYLDNVVNNLKAQWSVGKGRIPTGATQPTYKVMTPQMVDEQSRIWQGETNYNTAQTPRSALQQRINKALAQGGRQWMEGISTPSLSVPGKTIGQVIGETNSQLSQLHPLAKAVQGVEDKLAGGTASVGMPAWAHAAFPAAGGTLGMMAGHLPGGTAGTLGGLMLDRLMSNPVIASRVALGLSNPAVQTGLQQLPRAGWTLAQLMNQPAPPDVMAGQQP